MKNQIEITPINEIVGAIAGSMASSADVAAFAKDPKGVLLSELNIDTDASISVVENSNDEIHLSLPYYAFVEEIQAKMLEDNSIDEVAGGEIFISIGVITALGISMACSAGAVVAGVACIAGGAIGAVVSVGVATGASFGAKAAKDSK